MKKKLSDFALRNAEKLVSESHDDDEIVLLSIEAGDVYLIREYIIAEVMKHIVSEMTAWAENRPPGDGLFDAEAVAIEFLKDFREPSGRLDADEIARAAVGKLDGLVDLFNVRTKGGVQ